MAQIQYRDNTGAVNELIKQNIINALTEVGMYIEGQAKRNIAKNLADNKKPKGEGYRRSGFLLNNMTFEVNIDDLSLKVGDLMKYAIFVEKGTGIHAVDGNGRQDPWVYFSDGKFHFTHGMEAQPFLEPAVFNNLDDIRAIFMRNLGRGLR